MSQKKATTNTNLAVEKNMTTKQKTVNKIINKTLLNSATRYIYIS